MVAGADGCLPDVGKRPMSSWDLLAFSIEIEVMCVMISCVSFSLGCVDKAVLDVFLRGIPGFFLDEVAEVVGRGVCFVREI